MVITALPQDTVRLIKSTQVITTPASIVKELIENSLDANATAVSVKLEKFGLLRVEVRDNGSGIREDDVQFIAKPHYTSKISSFSDLSALTSYGFRGEALSSLCAVSQVTVTTKRKEDPMGHSYTFNHLGEVTSKKPAATPNGTTIIVSNLFKNVPVRHHYYNNSRHCKDGLKNVEDIVWAMSVAAPNVHFTLTHDKVNVFLKNAASDVQNVFMNIFPDIYKNFTSRNRSVPNITVEVVLPNQKCCGKSDYSRSSADRLCILVNKRPVSYKALEKMAKAYFNQGTDGCHGRYPLGLIAITVLPDEVDVNLEPNKTKVFLKEEAVVLETLRGVLEELYGSVVNKKAILQNSEACDSPAEAIIDITCTFAGVSQLPGKTKSASVNKLASDADVSLCDNDDEFLQPTLPKRVKAKEETAVGSDKCTTVSKNYLLTAQPSRLEIQRSESAFVNPRLAPKVVIGRDVDELDFAASGGGGEGNQCQRLSNFEGSIITLKERIASTPVTQMNGSHFDLSLSTIKASGDSVNNSVESCNITPFSTKTIEHPLSSNVTGTSDSHSASSATIVKNPPKDNCNATTNELLMDDDIQTPPPLLDADSSKTHESMIGDDGIPVFKIAPLASEDFELVDFMESFQPGNVNEKINYSGLENHQKPAHALAKQTNNMESKENYNVLLTKATASVAMPTEKSQNDVLAQGSWSRGTTAEGKTIGTVQLLIPQNGNVLSTGKSSLKKNEGKRLLSLSDFNSSQASTSTPPKKTKVHSLGPASYDYFHSKPVKKPSSPFILYSRDIRSHVLSENPGADFAWVAKAMADRWKALDGETRRHYQDMAKEDADRFKREVSKIRESRGPNASLSLTPQKSMSCKVALDRYVAPLTPQLIKKEGMIVEKQPLVSKHPWKKRCKDVEISVAMIKDRIAKRCEVSSVDDSIRPIGPLVACGGWTCVKEGMVTALNISRLNEVILCRSLFKSFKVPVQTLKDPIPFNTSVIGENSWTLLLKLKRERDVNQNVFTVTDRRLSLNGFKVVLYSSTGDSTVISHGEIIAMTNNVGFYGINDLKEILSVLALNPAATVDQTRPLKLQFWLKGEVVRMVRGSPNLLCPEEVLSKLDLWKQVHQSLDGTAMTAWEDAKCFHDEPIFTSLYSLADLPLSQSHSQSASCPQ